jgi:Ca2+-binding RTX toxin-like protein
MAWRIPSSQTTTVTLAAAEDVFIDRNIAITVELGQGIIGAFTGHQALIYGLVASSGATQATIHFGSNASIHNSHIVDVKAGGHVQHLGVTVAVELEGYNSSLVNAGLISSPFGYGTWMTGNNALNASTLNNSGTIEAGIVAIGHDGSERLVVTNTGVIKSGNIAFASNGSAIDHVANSGLMIGFVSLGGGGDVYSGAAGHLIGKLLAGAGNDVAVGGIDNDWFEGGTENDSLAGNAGRDRLLGQDGNDTLNGGLGDDFLLDGGKGNDTLSGGPGWDYLTGGLNNDFFVFNTALNASTNRDIITDFSHVDDAFKLENAVFTKLGVGAGVHMLNPAFFRAGPKALDGNDYLVYDKANGGLSYDNDGSGAHAAIAFAVLANKPALAANDFVVI